MSNFQNCVAISTGETFNDPRNSRVQILYLCRQVWPKLVSNAANNDCPDQIHLSTRPAAILLSQPGMLLHPRHRGVEQVGKQKRQQQNKEGAARNIENGRHDREQSHGRDYISRTIVE